MKKVSFVIFLLAMSFGFANTLFARSGCCSSHSGVCGCGCCDGTSLSATCAPYYPACSASKKTVVTPIKITTAPIVKPKIDVSSDSYLDANYFGVCRLKSSSDKYLYRYNGQNYYDKDCALLVDPKTEKFIADNSLATIPAKVHYWSYILLTYKNNVK